MRVTLPPPPPPAEPSSHDGLPDPQAQAPAPGPIPAESSSTTTTTTESNPQSTHRRTTFTAASPLAPLSPLAARRATVARVTLGRQLALLRSTGRYDCFGLRWHPVYDDWRRFWPVPPHLFWDSDLGKWIEAAVYFLAERPDDRELDAAVRHLVGAMRAAQREDGYLNLHYIVVEPGRRWTNLRDMHEMYNAGHLLEAALAHHAHYQNTDFLDVMTKYVHLMHRHFGPGPGQRRGYPGHPELELALLRLHRRTGDRPAYELAHFFLTERGRNDDDDAGGGGVGGGGDAGHVVPHYYDVEMALRGDEAHRRPNSYPMSRDYWYCQAHMPLLSQPSVEGHAVRATYLLTAAADLLALHVDGTRPLPPSPPPSTTSTAATNPTTKQEDDSDSDGDAAARPWRAALRRLWDDMVTRKMYLTGGLGAVAQWEGFGAPHVLPQAPDEGGCYAETCASVGAVMLAERLLLPGCLAAAGDRGVDAAATATPDASIADVMELCLYNTILGSIGLGGDAFTYENYLASCPGHPCRREGWFDCSCCPPNVSRLFGSLGGYLWHFGSGSGSATVARGDDLEGEKEKEEEEEEEEEDAFVNVHLYASARVSFTTTRAGRPVVLEQKTNWPWEGNVLFTLSAHPATRTTIRLRVPTWAPRGSPYTLTPSAPSSPSSASSSPTTTAEPPAVQLSENGYLVLSPAYTRANPSFSVAFGGFAPRLVAPHPHTGQRTLALARGPLVYCVEDVDNPWEENHFKDVVLDGEAPVREEERECEGERYIALRGRGWSRVYADDWSVTGATPREERGEDRELVFVPYYLRANRGGKGHMRVGLLRP